MERKEVALYCYWFLYRTSVGCFVVLEAKMLWPIRLDWFRDYVIKVMYSFVIVRWFLDGVEMGMVRFEYSFDLKKHDLLAVVFIYNDKSTDNWAMISRLSLPFLSLIELAVREEEHSPVIRRFSQLLELCR